jgi:hypothetical protein
MERPLKAWKARRFFLFLTNLTKFSEIFAKFFRRLQKKPIDRRPNPWYLKQVAP